MKKIILLTFLFNYTICVSQIDFPFYEQIAFDFYQSTIIFSFPQEKKVKVYPYVSDFQVSESKFSIVFCEKLNRKVKEDFKELEGYVESQLKIDSDRFELDLSNLDKKKFKIKRRGKGKYPILQISPPNIMISEKELIFVNIYITNKNSFETYSIQMTRKGKVIDWCRSFDEIIRIY